MLEVQHRMRQTLRGFAADDTRGVRHEFDLYGVPGEWKFGGAKAGGFAAAEAASILEANTRFTGEMGRVVALWIVAAPDFFGHAENFWRIERFVIKGGKIHPSAHNAR